MKVIKIIVLVAVTFLTGFSQDTQYKRARSIHSTDQKSEEIHNPSNSISPASDKQNTGNNVDLQKTNQKVEAKKIETSKATDNNKGKTFGSAADSGEEIVLEKKTGAEPPVNAENLEKIKSKYNKKVNLKKSE